MSTINSDKLKNVKMKLIIGSIPNEDEPFGENGIVPFLDTKEVISFALTCKKYNSMIKKIIYKRKTFELEVMKQYYMKQREEFYKKKEQWIESTQKSDKKKLKHLSGKFSAFFLNYNADAQNLKTLQKLYELGASTTNTFDPHELGGGNLCIYIHNNYKEEYIFEKVKISILSELDNDHLFSQRRYAGNGGIRLAEWIFYFIFNQINSWFIFSRNDNIAQAVVQAIPNMFKIFELLYIVGLETQINNLIGQHFRDIEYNNQTKPICIKTLKMIVSLFSEIKDIDKYWDEEGNYFFNRFVCFIKFTFEFFCKYDILFIPTLINEIFKTNLIINKKRSKLLISKAIISDRLTIRKCFKNESCLEVFLKFKYINEIVFELFEMREFKSLKRLIKYELKIKGKCEVILLKNYEGETLLSFLEKSRGVLWKFQEYLLSLV